MDEKDLLQSLPLLLQKLIFTEVRSSIVERHCLFSWLKNMHSIVFRDACYSSLSFMETSAGHSIFSSGEACQDMFFVQSGTCRYVTDMRHDLARHVD